MALRIASVDWPKATRGSAPKTVEEARANAHLIAAAPEMLEALKAALNTHKGEQAPWKDMAFAALKKAEA